MVESVAGISDGRSGIKVSTMADGGLKGEDAVRRIWPHVACRTVKMPIISDTDKMLLTAEFQASAVLLHSPRDFH